MNDDLGRARRTGAPPRLERQVAEVVQGDEVHPGEVVGQAALAAGPALGLELVDQVDDVEEPAAGAAADAGAGDRDGQVGLCLPVPPTRHDFLGSLQESDRCVRQAGTDANAAHAASSDGLV